MGFYLGGRFLKVRVTKRGVRTSVGPRALRYHAGAGGSGISTGAGPVSYYHPIRSHPQRAAVAPAESDEYEYEPDPERRRQIRLYNRLFAVADYRDRKAAKRAAKQAEQDRQDKARRLAGLLAQRDAILAGASRRERRAARKRRGLLASWWGWPS
jgi:hypothetical protein